MPEENQLTIRESGFAVEPVPTEAIVKRVKAIHDLMKRIMKNGTHYGIVPGCKKPSLWKPGAEIICAAFQIRSEYDVRRGDMGDNHRDVMVTARLYHTPTGAYLGDGVASCNTRERKYLTPVENPHNDRNGNPVYFSPHDFYNTVEKMAAKRAQIAAVLTALSASEVFTQDIEDEDGDPVAGPAREKSRAPVDDRPGAIIFQGVVEGAKDKPGKKDGKPDGSTIYEAVINGRYIWTKDGGLGQELIASEGLEVVVNLKPGSKSNVYQLLGVQIPPRGQSTDETDDVP
jgi:hypothetical protein